MPSYLYERKPDGSVRARAVIDGKLRDLGRHPNDKAAMRAVRAARPPRAPRGIRIPKGPVTVGEWAEIWQWLFPGKPPRNEATRAHNEAMCSAFVNAYRGKRLSDISILMAQAWAVQHPGHVRFLRTMFGAAVRAQILGLNVWVHVEIEERSEPRMPPTREQLERMVAFARGRGGWWEHFADCVVFTAYSGLRREEVERVQVADVLEAGRRVVVRGKRGPGEVDPRVRTVAVFGPGREALRAQLPQVGRVWRAPKGGPLTQDVVDMYYGELRRECDVSSTFHGLRHYVTGWLLDQGATKVDVAILLGHRDKAGRVDTKQVEKVYGHMAVEPALKRLEAVVYEGVPDGTAASVRGAAAHGGAADGGVESR